MSHSLQPQPSPCFRHSLGAPLGAQQSGWQTARLAWVTEFAGRGATATQLLRPHVAEPVPVGALVAVQQVRARQAAPPPVTAPREPWVYSRNLSPSCAAPSSRSPERVLFSSTWTRPVSAEPLVERRPATLAHSPEPACQPFASSSSAPRIADAQRCMRLTSDGGRTLLAPSPEPACQPSASSSSAQRTSDTQRCLRLTSDGGRTFMAPSPEPACQPSASSSSAQRTSDTQRCLRLTSDGGRNPYPPAPLQSSPEWALVPSTWTPGPSPVTVLESRPVAVAPRHLVQRRTSDDGRTRGSLSRSLYVPSSPPYPSGGCVSGRDAKLNHPTPTLMSRALLSPALQYRARLVSELSKSTLTSQPGEGSDTVPSVPPSLGLSPPCDDLVVRVPPSPPLAASRSLSPPQGSKLSTRLRQLPKPKPSGREPAYPVFNKILEGSFERSRSSSPSSQSSHSTPGAPIARRLQWNYEPSQRALATTPSPPADVRFTPSSPPAPAVWRLSPVSATDNARFMKSREQQALENTLEELVKRDAMDAGADTTADTSSSAPLHSPMGSPQGKDVAPKRCIEDEDEVRVQRKASASSIDSKGSARKAKLVLKPLEEHEPAGAAKAKAATNRQRPQANNQPKNQRSSRSTLNIPLVRPPSRKTTPTNLPSPGKVSPGRARPHSWSSERIHSPSKESSSKWPSDFVDQDLKDMGVELITGQALCDSNELSASDGLGDPTGVASLDISALLDPQIEARRTSIGLSQFRQQAVLASPDAAMHPERAGVGLTLLRRVINAFQGKPSELHGADLVERLFLASMPEKYVEIESIKLVMQPMLCKRFTQQVSTAKCAVEATFHGTQEKYLQDILRDGLSPSMCTTGAFGTGAYVGTHAGVAHQYADPDANGKRHMCVVLVVVGSEVSKGHQGEQTTKTALDSLCNPTQYCFTDASRMYISHVITYSVTQTQVHRTGGGWDDPFEKALNAAVRRAATIANACGIR